VARVLPLKQNLSVLSKRLVFSGVRMSGRIFWKLSNSL
jgi:hypothetical protein